MGINQRSILIQFGNNALTSIKNVVQVVLWSKTFVPPFTNPKRVPCHNSIS